MADQDKETVPVNRQSSDLVQTSLELRIRFSDRPRKVVPINRALLEYEFEDGLVLRFAYHNGQLKFSGSTAVYKDGEAMESGLLEVGGTLEVGGHRVLLWDTDRPVAYLKGYSAPYSNELWALGPGSHPIGRPGKRNNTVSLDHPTVSRAHAVIVGHPDGRYELMAESSTNPVCLGGSELEPGATHPLSHGDLLEFGELVLRFHQPGGADENRSLEVRSLGGLRVKLAGQAIADQAWATQKVKYLFCRLAYSWDRPMAVEQLMEELWPESDLQKARNNFKYTLSTLRKLLRSQLPDELQELNPIPRSSSSVQLNPDLLDRHDVVDLQRLARTPSHQRHPGWETAVQEAVLSYAGPFLPECYLDWAVGVRQTLEIQMLDLAKALLARFEEQSAWDRLIALGSHVLQVERHAQWACLLVMRALRHSQRAAEALRLFERSREVWMQELGLEPEMELLREHQRLLALV